jgi:hypothetical protein
VNHHFDLHFGIILLFRPGLRAKTNLDKPGHCAEHLSYGISNPLSDSAP